MDEKDKKRFWSCMKAMFLNAGQENIEDPAVAKLYFKALSDFSIEQVETAVLKAMRAWKSSKVIPIGVIVEQLESQAGKPEDKALVIANEIVSHLKRNGSRVYPSLDHDPIASRLMATRWPYRQWASEVLESELKWWVKEFCEAYASYSAVGDKVPEIALNTYAAKQLVSGIGKEIPHLKAIAGGIGG